MRRFAPTVLSLLLAIHPVLAAPPAEPVVQLATVRYQEQEDRMSLLVPMFRLLTPLGEQASLEINTLLDAVSGATLLPKPYGKTGRSPRSLDAISSATRPGNTQTAGMLPTRMTVRDHRQDLDAKLTGYAEDFDIGLKTAMSSESDYTSYTLGLDSHWYLNQKNTLITLGVGHGWDHAFLDQASARIRKPEVLAGITQELSPWDILQSNLSWSGERGRLDDLRQYMLTNKNQIIPDRRPDLRQRWAWLTRYNHFFPAWMAALHLDYRYYRDSWDIQAHDLSWSWSQNLGESWLIEPSLRYHTQDAASFYVTRLDGDPGGPVSGDGRLAAFGAISTGLRGVYRVSDVLAITLQGERYRQDNDWHWGNTGNHARPVAAWAGSVGIEIGLRAW